MIITGGEHVYPSEVEEVIGQHYKVFDRSVIGVSDDLWGEAVKAGVILKEGEIATQRRLLSGCRRKMARYKKPKCLGFISLKKCPEQQEKSYTEN